MLRHSVILLLCCLLAMVPQVQAQTATTPDMGQLQKEMYRLFPTRNTDEFMSVTERLKEASLKAGNEKLFYRTWANQATFAFAKISRERGIEIAKAMNDYAQAHDSKRGIYYASVVNASQAATLRMESEAEQLFLKAIEYKQKYLPDVDASAAYLGAAKVYVNMKRRDKVLEMTDKALAEPNIIGSSVVEAWAYRCMAAIMGTGDRRDELNAAYNEWKKAEEKFGYTSNLSRHIETYHAQVNGDYQRMLELAKEEKSPLERNKLMAHAYEWLGQWQQALKCYKEYKRTSDSINNDQVRNLSTAHTLQLDVIRAESEAKDLRLTNQALQLAQAQEELEHRRLEDEATSLTLKNRDMELRNAAMRMQNDSLDRQAQMLKLSEYRSRLEAQQQTEHAHHIMMLAVAVLALLVISFLAFYLHRRQRQMRTLRQAYNQLEEVTAHKERIESEVRIARDIQMSMVPRVFPQLNGIDLYASMTPAKAVGGDLYDFIVKSDSITFCVGDVSGKGIPASLFMSVAVNLFRNVAEEGFPPYYIATRMNETLAKDNENGMFVTMFIAQVDLHTGRMDFCNCGHNPPVLINSLASTGAEAAFIDMEPNAPLGLWPDLEFEGEYIENINGLTLFAYTDGLNEAENAQQEQFGEERLVELLQQHPDLSAQATIERVSQEVTAFVGDAEQSDDLTMFCLRINT